VIERQRLGTVLDSLMVLDQFDDLFGRQRQRFNL